MSLLDGIRKIKVPDSKKVMEIPSNLKTQTQQIELNTVDVLYFSHDWSNCFLITGLKNRLAKRPMINIKLPEKLACLEADFSSSFNLTTKRNLYLMNEKSPYTIPLNKISLVSSMMSLNPSHDENINDEQVDIDLTQKMLSTLGSVRLIDDINEKQNDGMSIVFIIGMLVGIISGVLISSFLFR